MDGIKKLMMIAKLAAVSGMIHGAIEGLEKLVGALKSAERCIDDVAHAMERGDDNTEDD